MLPPTPGTPVVRPMGPRAEAQWALRKGGKGPAHPWASLRSYAHAPGDALPPPLGSREAAMGSHEYASPPPLGPRTVACGRHAHPYYKTEKTRNSSLTSEALPYVVLGYIIIYIPQNYSQFMFIR